MADNGVNSPTKSVRFGLPDVVIAYRTAQGLSLRAFAAALNEKLINTDVSHESVRRWEQAQDHDEPDMRLLFECLATYEDWREEFARDCLWAMFPDLVGTKIKIVVR